MKTEKLRLVDLCTGQGYSASFQHVNLSLYDNETVLLYLPEPGCRDAFTALLTRHRTTCTGQLYLNSTLCHDVSTDVHWVSEKNQLAPHMCISDNLFLASDFASGPVFINYQLQHAATQDLLKKAGLCSLRPNFQCSFLKYFHQKLIESLRCITLKKDILLLDNVSARLLQQDEELFSHFLMYLKGLGKTILIITDNNDDLTPLSPMADRFIYISDGTVALNTTEPARSDIGKLVPPSNSGTLRAGRDLAALSVVFPSGQSLFRVHNNEVVGVIDPNWDVLPKLLHQCTHPTSNKEFILLFHEATSPDHKKSVGILYEKSLFRTCFHNMNLADNISISADDLVMHGLFYKNSLKDFLAKEMLSFIEHKDIYDKYHALHSLPKLEIEEELAIVIARQLTNSPCALFFIYEQINVSSEVVQSIRSLLFTLSRKRIPCVVLSKHSYQLDKMCDRTVRISAGRSS